MYRWTHGIRFRLMLTATLKKSSIVISILLMTFLIACTVSGDKKHIREQLNGEWARIVEKNEFNDFLMDPFFLPDGMAISNDSIEFYLGFFKASRDSITEEWTSTY